MYDKQQDLVGLHFEPMGDEIREAGRGENILL